MKITVACLKPTLSFISMFWSYTTVHVLPDSSNNWSKGNHCVKYRNFTYFLVWKFCGKAQFPHSFWKIALNYAGIVPFHKFCIFFSFFILII